MSDQDLDAEQIEAKVHDLAKAMEKVRDEQAMRSDVVVEMKQVAHARLELLAKDLQPVFQAVPDENEQFEFALTSGEPPRLWIDMTSFVRMGRDRRVYEFVKDTRLGRSILGQSKDRELIGKIVTNYVAERILERGRALEGDWLAMRSYDFDGEGELVEETVIEKSREGQNINGWQYLGWFLLGLFGGAAIMMLWAWFGEIPQFLQSAIFQQLTG